MVMKMPTLRRGARCGGTLLLKTSPTSHTPEANIKSAAQLAGPALPPHEDSDHKHVNFDGESLVRIAGNAATTAAQYVLRKDGSANSVGGSSQPYLVKPYLCREDPNDPLNKWLYYDSMCGIIVERWPKSAFHFLIFPRNTKVQSLNDVRGKHGLMLLEHMRQIAFSIVSSLPLHQKTNSPTDISECVARVDSESKIDKNRCQLSNVFYNSRTHLYSVVQRPNITSILTSHDNKTDNESPARSSLWEEAFPLGTFILGYASTKSNYNSRSVRKRKRRLQQECLRQGTVLPDIVTQQEIQLKKQRQNQQQKPDRHPLFEQHEMKHQIFEFEPAPDNYFLNNFFIGFEALPTYPMLKMEILSADLCGPCMVHKMQYQRMSSSSFLSVDDVIQDVRRHGYVTLNQKAPRIEYAISKGELPKTNASGDVPAGDSTHVVECRFCQSQHLSVRHMKIHTLHCDEAAAQLC